MLAVSAIGVQNHSQSLKQELSEALLTNIRSKSNSFTISTQMEICGSTLITEELRMISKKEIQVSFQYSKKLRSKLSSLKATKTTETPNS